MAQKQVLPAYTVRVSKRARQVLLKVSTEKGLEIVVPRGFDKRRVPNIVRRKADWISRAFADLRKRGYDENQAGMLPREITLQAVGECVAVDYEPAATGDLYLRQETGNRITLAGEVGDVPGCRHLLRQWLKSRGRVHLPGMLQAMSARTGLSYARTQIRCQRTRWGSCSSRSCISLNSCLLFLPRDLLDYVLVHELAHTEHLNHSSDYWALVNRLEPGWQALERRLRRGWDHVPAWVW